MIQSLLELGQDYEALYRFLENDFSYVIALAINNHDYFRRSVYMSTIPYLKALLQRNKSHSALLHIITEMAKIKH